MRPFVSRPRHPRVRRLARATAALALTLCPLAGASAAPGSAVAPPLPAWLRPQPGTLARVDVAPWLDSDEPEAALVASARSLHRDFSDDGSRPPDVVYEPIGARVRIVRALPRGVVEVRVVRDGRIAYAPAARVLPDVPTGARLRVAGGFGGEADFFAALSSPAAQAGNIASGTPVLALGTAAAAYDPGSSDLVRVRVRVLAGPAAGRFGWIPVAYVGVPQPVPGRGATIVERDCRCRPAAFAFEPATS